MNSPFEMITLIKHLGGKIRALSFKYDKVILGRGKVVSEVKGQVKVQLKMIKITRFFFSWKLRKEKLITLHKMNL